MTIGRQYQTPYEQDADSRYDESAHERNFDDLNPRADQEIDSQATEAEVIEPVPGESDQVESDQVDSVGSDHVESDDVEAVTVDPYAEASEERRDDPADLGIDVTGIEDVGVDEVSNDAATYPATYVPETPAGTHALDSEWQSLQGRFVDDPDAAVGEAAALVDEAMRRLLESLHDESSSGGAGDTSTEQKRLAFQRYRAVYEVLSRT